MFVASNSRKLIPFLTSIWLFFIAGSFSLSAQQAGDEPVVDTSALTALGDDYQNSILLLRNRFRIDHEVDEVTMVFFREFGSAPVVLVRPDGSKIFSSQAEKNNVEWYDDDTFDMIKIKNPVPGPWQAVGQVLPESRVMVLSGIELHADPLPAVIFSGEVLKQTAYLTNGGQPIDYSAFREVVDLSIELKSTNNPNFDNFGAKDELIATFEDNGRGMDEAPEDGVFTGQFNLAIPSGEWRPVFTVDTPMFSREQIDPVIMLHPNPVVLSETLDDGQQGYHDLHIDVVRDQIDIESLLIDGKVRFPNGDIQNFSITEPSSEARLHRILAYEGGLFRVKITAYASTTDGRDVILDVPEYTFLGETGGEENDEAPVTGGAGDLEAALLKDTPSMPSVQLPPEEPRMDDGTMIMLIAVVNGSIILIGVIIVGFIVWKRKKAAKPAVAPAAPQATTGAEDKEKKPGMLAGLLSKFKKKKPDSEEK